VKAAVVQGLLLFFVLVARSVAEEPRSLPDTLPVYVAPGFVTTFLFPAPIAYVAVGVSDDKALKVEVLPAPHNHTMVLRVTPALLALAQGRNVLTNLVVQAGRTAYEFELRPARSEVQTRVIVGSDPVEAAYRQGYQHGLEEGRRRTPEWLEALARAARDERFRIEVLPADRPDPKASFCQTVDARKLCVRVRSS